MKKFGLDIDGVLCNFSEGFYNHFRRPYVPPKTYKDAFVSKNFGKIARDKFFWLRLKPLVDPSVIPPEVYCYITSRTIDSHISHLWLEMNGFPKAPVFTVRRSGKKSEIVKDLQLEVFVDDKITTYHEINNGTDCTCYLMKASYTEEEEVPHKIDDLKDLHSIL